MIDFKLVIVFLICNEVEWLLFSNIRFRLRFSWVLKLKVVVWMLVISEIINDGRFLIYRFYLIILVNVFFMWKKKGDGR